MSAAEAEAIFMARFNLSPNCDTVQGGDGNQIQVGAISSKARIDEAGSGTSEDLRRSLTSARIGVAMSTTFSESKYLDATDVLLQVCACLEFHPDFYCIFLWLGACLQTLCAKK